MLALNYANWTYWAEYDPSNGFLGSQKVTFDGLNKLILVNYGETYLDFREDVYSAWKEWVTDSNQVNSKYIQALSIIGGDPLPGSRALGTTYFIENGWRMRTWEGDHSLTIIGNVYTREGAPIFIPTITRVTTTIELVNSTLPETLIPTVSLSNTDITAVSGAVWNEDLTSYTTANTAGRYVRETANLSITVPNIPTANEIAVQVWSADIANNAANTAGKTLETILKLETADEVYDSANNTLTKVDKDNANNVLLTKTAAGLPIANTVTITGA